MSNFDASNIKLVIGLGNPGQDYANTYHNAGLLFIDYLASNSRLTTHDPPPKNLKLLKSDTYMNESGAYVKKAMKKHGAKPEEVLIAHDESDLALGTFKLSFDRSSAGHKGVQSVMDSLGTKKFWRLRIGTRAASKGNMKAIGFVLKKINRADQGVLAETFEQILTALLA